MECYVQIIWIPRLNRGMTKHQIILRAEDGKAVIVEKCDSPVIALNMTL
jgi:hypothetical protein